MAISVQYYRLVNSGVGVVIYPQIRLASNSSQVIWDGREQPGFHWMLDVGEEVIVNFHQDTPALQPGIEYLFSLNMVAGEDDWDPNDPFTVDADSNLMATCHKYGGADNGGIQFDGVTPYNGEAAAKAETYREKNPGLAKLVATDLVKTKA